MIFHRIDTVHGVPSGIELSRKVQGNRESAIGEEDSQSGRFAVMGIAVSCTLRQWHFEYLELVVWYLS